MSSGQGWASDGTSVDAVVRGFEADGYRGQFAAREGGRVLCLACRRENDAGDFGLEALRRTEGASDPADMVMVAAVTCPNCGEGGTLVLNYGPEADADGAEVLRRLDDLRPRRDTGSSAEDHAR